LSKHTVENWLNSSTVLLSTHLVNLSCCSLLAFSSGNTFSNSSLFFASRDLQHRGGRRQIGKGSLTLYETQSYIHCTHFFLLLLSILSIPLSHSAMCASYCSHNCSSCTEMEDNRRMMSPKSIATRQVKGVTEIQICMFWIHIRWKGSRWRWVYYAGIISVHGA